MGSPTRPGSSRRSAGSRPPSPPSGGARSADPTRPDTFEGVAAEVESPLLSHRPAVEAGPGRRRAVSMSDPYSPRPEHKFTFGLWTVGNPGRDPFGEPVRPSLTPGQIVHLLAEVGAYGVNFHDNDLVPITATAAEQDRIVRDFKKALADTG